MPNWCENYIEITGDKESIQRIKEKIGNNPDADGIFFSLIGREKSENRERISEELDNYFGGNLSIFGTKWDVSYEDCNFTFNEESIILSPLTAWSPPNNFCITLSEKYEVKVVNIFGEPGNDFSGRLIVDSGEVKELSEHPYLEGIYKLDPEDFWGRIEGYLECEIQDEVIDGEKTIDEVVEGYEFITNEGDKNKLREICEDLVEEFS